MRTLHELYLLLWEEIKDMEELNDGLCFFTFCLWGIGIFTTEEEQSLFDDFKHNKPENAGFPFWFEDGETGTKQRKEFVSQMIEKTKPL